jgi:phthalate 4,5-dioxygenase oxygenase subunit
MPNEPEQGDFKHRVKAQAYPTRERGGLVWAYLGPRKDAPPLPDLEANMSPESDQNIRVIQLDSSWLQILEGDIDTVHASLLHYGSLRADDQPPGTFSEYQLRQRSARFEVIDTEGGVAYGAYRPAGPGRWYWRIAQYLFPIYTMAPPGVLGLVRSAICRVPMDDHHTMNFFLSAGRRPVAAAQSDGRKPSPLGALVPLQPNTTDWYGRFRPVQQADNDFLIDRELQQRNKGPAGYSGIQTIVMQDAAMTSSMGPIYDRSKERLGSTDAAVIRVRRRLLAAVRAYLRGVTPPAVDDPEAYRARSGGIFLPEDADWVEATRALRRGMVEHPDLDPALNGPL